MAFLAKNEQVEAATKGHVKPLKVGLEKKATH